MADDINAEDLPQEKQDLVLSYRGVTVGRVHSLPPLASAARVEELGDRADTRPETLDYINDTRQEDQRRKGGTRLARRIAALRPSLDDRDNRPIIMVLGRRIEDDSSAIFDPRSYTGLTIINTFDHFILSGVQEQDAEKTFVVETFGNPHVFSSGRFTRKFTFTGRVRTAPVNYQSREPRYALPQSVLLRKFYDDYLRSTQQIRHRRFTRVIVDGDVYDGYITTLNLSRTSEVEHFADFAVTMIGLRRTHAELEQMADKYLRERFFFRGTTAGNFNDSIAGAEAEDAFGKLELKLTEGVDSADRLDNLTVTKQLVLTRTNTQDPSRVALHAVGHPQVLRVATEAKGVDLLYRRATASSAPGTESGVTGRRVNGSAAAAGEEGDPGRLLELAVTSYRALYEYLSKTGETNPDQSAGDQGNQVVEGNVSFRIFSVTGGPVVLTYKLRLEGREQWKLDTVEALFGSSNASIGGAPENHVYTFPSQRAYVSDGADGAVDLTGAVPFTFYVGFKDSAGNELDAALYSPGKVTFDVALAAQDGIFPAITDRYRKVTDAPDPSLISGSLGGITVTPEPQHRRFLISGDVNLRAVKGGAAADLRDENDWPFSFATRIAMSLVVTPRIPGLSAPKDQYGTERNNFVVRFGISGPQLPSSRALGITRVTFTPGLVYGNRVSRVGTFRIEVTKKAGANGRLSEAQRIEMIAHGRLTMQFQDFAGVTINLDKGSATTQMLVTAGFNQTYPLRFEIPHTFSTGSGVRDVRFTETADAYFTEVAVVLDTTKTDVIEEAASEITDIAHQLGRWTLVEYITPEGIEPPLAARK